MENIIVKTTDTCFILETKLQGTMRTVTQLFVSGFYYQALWETPSNSMQSFTDVHLL